MTRFRPEPGSSGERPFPPDDVDCELCKADRFTHWYAESGDGWIADCEACMVPIVVWWNHGTSLSPHTRKALLDQLSEVANDRFGPDNWYVDEDMRQVPEHFHAHARDTDWWAKRFTRPMSRYKGVGVNREG